MGKLKLVGIAFGGIISLIIIGALVSSVAEGVKYSGLTDQQITSVKAIKQACDNQAALASIQNSAVGDKMTEKCNQIEAQKIAEYKAADGVK